MNDNKTIIQQFIEAIWNQNQFEQLDTYLAPNYIDHSLPPALAANAEGLRKWILATGESFEHQTIIENMVAEDDQVMIKIKMKLKHIGTWRAIEATHFEIATTGFRYYKLANGKITHHWALIDGNAIENQLKDSHHGCKIQ